MRNHASSPPQAEFFWIWELQILKKNRPFGADFDLIYTVIIHINDVLGLFLKVWRPEMSRFEVSVFFMHFGIGEIDFR